MEKTLIEKVFAYNREIIMQELKAQKVEKIREMVAYMGEHSSLSEFVTFFDKLQRLLQDT